MPSMPGNGLVRIIANCGELSRAAANELAGSQTTTHKLEETVADMIAACVYVIEKCDLKSKSVEARIERKLALYRKWGQEK